MSLNRKKSMLGKLEFDVLINGEKVERVADGLLVAKRADGVELMVKGLDIEIMIKAVIALTCHLADMGCADLLLNIMDREMGGDK